MRILHIGKFFPPHAGGIERFSADLTAALSARGVDVAMLAHAPPGEATRKFVDSGVDVVLAACHGQFLYAPLSPSFPLHLRRIIRDFRPQALHLHMPNVSAFWALLSPAARALPWVVHWHADIPQTAQRTGLRAGYTFYRPWEQALLRRARAIVATSRNYLEASTALAPWREKTRVIPLGIDSTADVVADARSGSGSAFREVHWPSAGIRVLAVGRLSHYKGFDVLLDAVARLPSVSLLLIGSGECAAALRARASELGIEARVRFAGHADEATLAAAYARAQIFCLPSTGRSEAFGIVLLEAMRARLPVVATAIPGSGVEYVVDHGRAGLLAAPADAASLTQALGSLAADAALRERFAAAGHARWQAEFTLARCAQQILDLYRSL